MDTRERFINTFTGKSIDRPMRYDCFGFWPETIKRWKSEGLDEVLDGKEINKYFEMESLEIIELRSGFTSPFHPIFEKVLLDEDEKTIKIIDHDGIKKRLIKEDKYLSMPQFLEFPVKTRDDYILIRERLLPGTEARLKLSIDECKGRYLNRDFPLGMYICGGFAHPRELMGLETYLFMMFDEPDLIHEIMRDWLDLYLVLTEDIIKRFKLDFVYIWEDMCYKNGPLLSPAMYDEFACPYLKKLIDAIKNNGVDIILLDSDGNINSMIDLYIKCGVNVLFPFEVQAGMDILEVRRRYPELGIIGGLDKKVLAKGKEDIKEEVILKVPEMYRSGKYIASLDHSVPPDVSLKNYIYYVDLLRSLENDRRR